MLLSDKNFESLYENFASEAELEPAPHYELDVCSIIDGLHPGDRLRILGEHSKRFEARMGEMTILAGASGHGKSAMMGQVGLDFAGQGKKVCIMSFEMTPARTLYRMCRQCCGSGLTSDQAAATLKKMDDKIIVLNKVGSANPKFVYGAAIKAAQDYGCTHIIIDNLMKVCSEYGDSAMNSQKDFIETLCALAKALKVHIWLVCHVRKGSNETDEINKYSIRGSAAITDQADNVILFVRNLAKERKIEESKGDTTIIDLENPDATMIIDKQRNGEWQGSVRFWYDRDSWCFCPTPSRTSIEFFRGKK